MRILVVDDNRSSAQALARALSKQGHEAQAVFDGNSAIARLGDEDARPDLVLTDLKMEPVDGMEVLRAARDRRPAIDVIVFTAYGAVDTAVEAMQLGAHDFLTKPVTLDQITARIDDLNRPEAETLSPITDDDDDLDFIAVSPSAVALLQTLKRVANVESHVWLEGEIGSGRGHAAITIHRLAGAEGPFTTIDVSRFEAWPTSGTAFLPNVDDLPDDLQRELVRHLAYVPEGLRLIASAGPDAREKVGEGRLRPELYYHLAVIVIPVPALRERVDDILPILQHCMEGLAARHKQPIPEIDGDDAERLRAHAWPGNIRELLNVAERALVLGGDALELSVVRRPSAGLPTLEPGFSLSNYLEAMEKRILAEALRRTGGDRNAAGRLLGVERNTLRYKLNKYGLLDK